MAKENVKKFLEELSANKELQEKFIEVQKGYEAEGKSEEEIFEDIVLPIAKEAGFEFTVSEYRGAQREAMAESGMSEEELENVSGGGICLFIGMGFSAGMCLVVGGNKSENVRESNVTIGLGFDHCSDFLGSGIGFHF